MRIAMLGTRGAPARYGGFETAVEEVGARLVEQGHEVIVYCRNPGQTLTEHRGMRLINLPAVHRRAAETISHTAVSVGHMLGHRHPDVAFVFNAANAPFLPLMQAAGIPTAVHVDGLEWQRAKWGPRARRYYLWAEAASTRWSDAVIADAHGIAEHIWRTYGVTAVYLAYGAPLVEPSPDRLVPMGLAPHGFHLAVARLEPENQVREIVAGFAASQARLPLIVVGDAPYSDRYRREVLAAAGGDSRIRLIGSIWDDRLLDTLYGSCLTYLHGHSVGGTNPSLLRALGAAAPVVAFDVTFNREVAGAWGRYFRTPSDLAIQVQQAEEHPEDALARGRGGRSDAALRYDWEDVARGYASLAERLVRKRRAGAREWALSRPHARR